MTTHGVSGLGSGQIADDLFMLWLLYRNSFLDSQHSHFLLDSDFVLHFINLSLLLLQILDLVLLVYLFLESFSHCILLCFFLALDNDLFVSPLG